MPHCCNKSSSLTLFVDDFSVHNLWADGWYNGHMKVSCDERKCQNVWCWMFEMFYSEENQVLLGVFLQRNIIDSVKLWKYRHKVFSRLVVFSFPPGAHWWCKPILHFASAHNLRREVSVKLTWFLHCLVKRKQSSSSSFRLPSLSTQDAFRHSAECWLAMLWQCSETQYTINVVVVKHELLCSLSTAVLIKMEVYLLRQTHMRQTTEKHGWNASRADKP